MSIRHDHAGIDREPLAAEPVPRPVVRNSGPWLCLAV
jgi:hypothetical protein